MNVQVDEQQRISEPGNRFVSFQGSLDQLTVTVFAVPMPTPPANSATPGDRIELSVGSGYADDLANATWEDAEWQ